MFGKDVLGVKKSFECNKKNFDFFSISKALDNLGYDIKKYPFSIRVLIENMIRHQSGNDPSSDLKNIASWISLKKSSQEISYYPARVLMQDFTGVPALVDLAAMRDAIKQLGGDPKKINPVTPVDLVIDHSLQVDKFGSDDAYSMNVKYEMERNYERYKFLRWGQQSFSNLRVVPPGTGICHQVNLEYLARVVWNKNIDGVNYLYPDTVVGTDSHTTMINALGVLGWGVGGIEAEAVMLGQSVSMIVPEVVGVKISGKLKEGVTATDLVLHITNLLRAKGVVNKFVEFFGNDLKNLSLANRATIANMAPEYGATCGFFPVDSETIKYLKLSARDDQQIELVEQYCKLQNLWRDENTIDPEFSDVVYIDLESISPSVAGPKRPQDKINLTDVTNGFLKDYELDHDSNKNMPQKQGEKLDIQDAHVVIAAITSCTNTSNPSVMLAAGLVAKKAIELGIKVKPWVKTSLAPGSQVVSEYLINSGLQKYLDMLGFNVVGYGCTTCIGNSGPIDKEIERQITENDVVAVSVLSGNRNFEGRVHPLTKANYLASPPLVVAYAIAGSMKIDISKEPIAYNQNQEPIYLKDIWPSSEEINDILDKFVTKKIFAKKYSNIFDGDKEWQNIEITENELYNWQKNSTYIQRPSFLENISAKIANTNNINNAYVLAMLGDSVTTDHISPAGVIAKNSPAANYLQSQNVEDKDFNSYGARRGNHNIMVRGTFANIRIKNELAPGTEGGYTTYFPQGKIMSIYDAAQKYAQDKIPLIVIAGKEYGTGSSRDWAAKGTLLLGVKVVIAESFERIHRSNLVRMGVLPLVFMDGQNRHKLALTGNESFSFSNLEDLNNPMSEIICQIKYHDGRVENIKLRSRIDTEEEVKYYQNGGILQTVLRSFLY